MSTSHTAVVRPRCRRRAVAWIVPPVIGRRKLVWLEIARPSVSGVGDHRVDAAVHQAERLFVGVGDG